MASKQDDPIGAQALRGDHTAQANRAIADDRDSFSGSDLRHASRVMSRAHDIRQREQ
jgi:hypothetical protein